MAHSARLLSEIELALPTGATGLPVRAVHACVGRWSRTTVRHALRELVADGRATFEGPDGARRYRRVEVENA